MKKFKKLSLKTFSKYNDFEKNNREVVEIDEQTYNTLPLSEKQNFKIVMTRDKSKTKPPKGPTDHDLLVMLISEFREFKGYVINNFKRIDSEFKEFKSYVLDVFKRNNLK